MTRVGRSKSAAVKRVDSSIVGVVVPDEAAVVKAQSEALAAFEVLSGRAEERGAAEVESMEDAGLLSDREAEVVEGLVADNYLISNEGHQSYIQPDQE